jgi:cytochrome oxidase Cu insertion factor (SCO1/SenC/PrrC family)
VLGIVTNGDGWRFYRLDRSGQVYETGLYSNRNPAELLGALHHLLQQCDRTSQSTL